MPPKARITKEMVLDAAFALVRECGIESLSARSVAGRLGCSTQPIMYCFSTTEELRNAVFERTDEYQTRFIMTGIPTILNVGMQYVRFAAEEKHLFRFLFQSDRFSQQTLDNLVNDESVRPLIEAIAKNKGVSLDAAKDAFAARFMMVHGMASLLANNSMVYDADHVRRLLEEQFGRDFDIE